MTSRRVAVRPRLVYLPLAAPLEYTRRGLAQLVPLAALLEYTRRGLAQLVSCP